MSQFPRIARVLVLDPLPRRQVNPHYHGPLCECCGRPATHKTIVEINWCEGDNERVCTCLTHAQDIDAILDSWQKDALEVRHVPVLST